MRRGPCDARPHLPIRPHMPSPAAPPAVAGPLAQLLRRGGVRSLYQPIVDLDTGHPVAYEALARGPQGSPLESPGALFGAAHELGIVAELDRACRSAAIEGALAARLPPPQALFVNVEPAAVLGDDAPLSHEDDLRRRAPARGRRAHRARAHRPPGRGARRRRLAARARLRDRARRRRRRRALARADAVPRARRDQARHVADPGARRLAGRGARAQRRRRRGRALRRGAARRGDRDRGAPRTGARGRRDARPGLAVRSPRAAAGRRAGRRASTACRCARTSRCPPARRSS